MRSNSIAAQQLLDGMKTHAPGLGGEARRQPYARHSDTGGNFRHRVDPQCRNRDGQGRIAEHVRPRPQSGVSDVCRGAGVSARHTHIVGGMCETDYSGYPDCRNDTIKALQIALNLGMDKQFELHTPLMWLDKAATWALAERTRRSRAGRSDPRALAHLLSRRARRAARLGLWLRRMSGVQIARKGLAAIRGARA